MVEIAAETCWWECCE